MLKWVLGCLSLAIVVVGCTIWFGYRKLKTFADAGPASTVTIVATPARVFASIADADSMTEWRTEGLGIRASHHGLLKLGDTLLVQSQRAGASQPSRATWMVTALVPDKLLALEARNDSTGAAMFTRRDSLIALGDSTQVVSTFGAPIMDSIRARRADSGGAGTAMLGMTSKLMMGAMRLLSEQELKRLKARIEGRAVGDSAAPRSR